MLIKQRQISRSPDNTIQKCDEILVIDSGRIMERGSHQELLAKRGIYYNLYLLQWGVDNNGQG